MSMTKLSGFFLDENIKSMCKKEQFETVGDGLLVRAPAKINLSLLVNGKRPDGYHNIETIMAKVSLYDEIILEKGRKKGIELVCKGRYPAPQGPANIVHKAAMLMMNKLDTNEDIRITLIKNIPPGSGLGGASSDAASTLLGINKLFQPGTGNNNMVKLAACLGSDVPFFLGGPLSICKGRGEKIKEIVQKSDFMSLLVMPDITITTKMVYENFKPDNSLFESFSRRISMLLQKNRIDLVPQMCANMLLTSCLNLYGEIAEIKKKIEDLHIGPICLSGSGSCFFLFLQDFTRIKIFRKMISEKIGCRCVIVCSNRW